MSPEFEEMHKAIVAKEETVEEKINSYPSDVAYLRFFKQKISVLPDISRFKNLDTIIFAYSDLLEIPENIGDLETLEMVVFCGNKITKVPKSIGKLKNVKFINLTDNPITDFPEEIKYLDTSNGGNLFRMAVDKEDMGEENYKRLKELLPNVFFTSLR